MRTELMIEQLRKESEKRRNDRVDTFQTNISIMCYEVANRLEEQEQEIVRLNAEIKRAKRIIASMRLD